jgi:SurA N-terminal domain
MQENNETNNPTNSTVLTATTESVTTPSPEESVVATPVPSHSARFGAVKRYALVGVVVIIMAIGLLYALERDGRVTTGLFGDISGNLAAAVVNGEKITRSDLESSVNQLLQMAAAQGSDITSPDVQAEYRSQALDTLVNGELLRQAAIAEGMTAEGDAIDARLLEIETGAGGKEALTAKMNEFGITEAVLRRDIENEILISSLFEKKFPTADMVIEEAEIQELYDQAGGAAAGLPPLSEVSVQVAEQIKMNRQQQMVSAYIDELRTAAEIELLM